MPAETAPLIPGYQIRSGSNKDRGLLVEFMQRTYQELCPGRNFDHLAQTVEQYFSEQTPYWWVQVEFSSTNRLAQAVACLWLGHAVDQVRGDRHTHIFLLYVAPEHRRHGIGSALVHYTEEWARARGEQQIGLQVFQFNHTALAFYRSLGYQPQALWMVKPLGS